ncbi:MAG: hypothetical protein AABY22_06245 [Nanoarchaeota archaeon]
MSANDYPSNKQDDRIWAYISNLKEKERKELRDQAICEVFGNVYFEAPKELPDNLIKVSKNSKNIKIRQAFAPDIIAYSILEGGKNISDLTLLFSQIEDERSEYEFSIAKIWIKDDSNWQL